MPKHAPRVGRVQRRHHRLVLQGVVDRGDPRATWRDVRRGSIGRPDLQSHRRGRRGARDVAVPAAGRLYPVLYIDAIFVKVRAGQVANRPVYVAIGVDCHGERRAGRVARHRRRGRQVLAGLLTELRNRGVADVIFVAATGSRACPRRSGRSGRRRSCRPASSTSYGPRCGMRPGRTGSRSAALRASTPPRPAAAAEPRSPVRAGRGDRYPAIIRLWRNAWERFTPFLAFPPGSGKSSTRPT